MRNCKTHPFIDEYIAKIKSGEIPSSKELKREMKRVEKLLKSPSVIIKTEKIDRAKELIEKYFELKLFDWELFVIGLVHCYEIKDEKELVLFDEYLIVMGRGNGKNGFIAAITWYLTTYEHGIRAYNVDIIANSEDQAKTSFNDVFEMLELNWKKLKNFYTKTKELIVSKRTKSYLRFNTSNPRTKDGARSACLVFDEIHAYENYDMIKVFKQGFGKRPHSRVFYITTQGFVRGGVLDEELDISKRISSGEIKTSRRVSLIYKIDSKKDANNPELWQKACPSINYLPDLKYEMEKEHGKMEYQHHVALDFFTKRMNLPSQDRYKAVTSWAKVLKTNQKIPLEKLKGKNAIGSLDYAMINDFASVGLLFKYEGKRIFLEHSFVCHKSLQSDSRKIKFPIQEAADKGLITIVYKDAITPDIIADWFVEMGKLYNIVTIAADDYRLSLVREEFLQRGLPFKAVRSGAITHAKIAPLIELLFAEERFVFGDNMTMRWYISNTYKEIDKKGNTTYKKIEPKTRKTDGFFALLHAMSKDDELSDEAGEVSPLELKVYTY